MIGQRFTIPHPDSQDACRGIVERLDGDMVDIQLAVGSPLPDGRITHHIEYWSMRREIVEACIYAQKKNADASNAVETRIKGNQAQAG